MEREGAPSFRYTLGGTPWCRVKRWEKWYRSAKPQWRAIELIVMSVRMRRVSARARRSPSVQAATLIPNSAWKSRLRYQARRRRRRTAPLPLHSLPTQGLVACPDRRQASRGRPGADRRHRAEREDDAVSMLFIKSEGEPGQAWHQDETHIPTRDRSPLRLH